ncbi:YbaL family putative K(+) efflux transporter [Gilliamella sp. B2838]|uniref:YbaL family putative K(+) efflux transporter n=1 Tax=Gilliamella sp. B2838 TaxID=2818020 RepID=UPI003A5D00DF|nr:Kef family K(+) transporter [Gilliamella sp. B2838]
MHDTGPLLIAIIGGIVLATLLGLLANRLRISPLVGYLIAGIIVGPTTPGFVADTSIVQELAEIGIILLMFGVGLHFSLKDLMQVKNIAIPGAIVQITVATLLGMGMSSLIGWPILTGLVFGLCLSTASTVVLLRALEDRNLIESRRGKIAVGWLIVEDLVMVLTLVLLPAIATMFSDSDNYNTIDIVKEVAKTIGLVILFIAIMIVIGRRTIPWLLAKSAATGSEELFTLTVLAIALGIALAAVQLFGASFALGAFFAGIVLTESDLSHRAAKNILPLKDAFAVLFFVSVGMLFKPQILLIHPIAVLSVIVIIILGKSLAAYLIVRLFGYSKRTALTISASLAQIGEFAYILAALGITLQIFPDEAHSLILAGSIISIVLNPFIFNLLEYYLSRTENIVDRMIDPIIEINQQIPEVKNHAILIGYDRLGSMIAEKLIAHHVPFIVIEPSLTLVEKIRHDGLIAVFGNAIKPGILNFAHIKSAKWLIITSPNGYKSAEISQQAKTVNPDLEIYVRAFYEDEIEYIEEHGATKVVTGEEEIANHLLQFLNIDKEHETNNQYQVSQTMSIDMETSNTNNNLKVKIDIPVNANLAAGNGSPIE